MIEIGVKMETINVIHMKLVENGVVFYRLNVSIRPINNSNLNVDVDKVLMQSINV